MDLSRVSTRNLSYVALGAVLLVVVVIIWVNWPSKDTPAPRERQYRELTACLLTDRQGVVTEPASAAWAGMQKASDETLVRVQYLAVSGPQTIENAATFFNTLAVQKCGMIVAVGDVQVAALLAGKTQFPDIRYVVIGPAQADATVRVVPASGGTELTSAMAALVTEFAGATADR